MYLSVSPNPYEESSEEDAFVQVFTPNLEQLEALEEINQDKLYFNKGMNKINPKNTITFEDFDKYYKKFAEVDEDNEIEAANYEKPSFFVNLSQEKVFSSFENEKVVNVLLQETEIFKSSKNQCCKIEVEIEENDDQEKQEKSDKTKESTQANNIIDVEKNEIMTKFDINETHNDFEDIYHSQYPQYENINSNLSLNNDNDNDTFTFEKPKSIYRKKYDDNNFPFTQGKGIIHCIKLFDEPNNSNENNPNVTPTISQYSISSNKSINKDILSQTMTEKNSTDNYIEEENSLYSEQTVNINDDSLFKFTTKKYFYTQNGKRRRIKKNRKYKSDDIRKKIKSRFHKTLKNIINENLKKAGSKKLFDFLPQCFIGNVSKKTNNFCLNLTFRELLLKDFVTESNKESYPNKNVDYKKYLKNKETLEYLDDNPEICKKSGFDIIQEMKYKNLLNIYFNSGEFEESLIRLKKENETKEYVQEYVIKAKRYVDFYTNIEKDENKEENSEYNN